MNYLKTFKDDIVTRFWEGSITGVNNDWVKLSSFTAGQPVQFPIKGELIKGNEGGTVKAYYQIERAAGGTSYSDTLEFSVGVALDLKEPEIKEAPNNILQPFAAKDTLTAIVRAYPDMIGTRVSVTWTGTPGEGSKTEGPIDVTAHQDLEVPLPNFLVAFNLGKTVRVIYTVIRNGVPQNSDELSLTVLPIADGDQNLPTPSIDGAVGDELDVMQLEEDAQLRIEKWMLQTVGQCIWLCYNGTDKNGNAVEKVLWAGEANNQDEGLVTGVDVTWVQTLKNESPLEIVLKVNFGKVKDTATAVRFPLRNYIVKNVAKTSGYEDWKSVPSQDFNVGIPVSFDSELTLMVLESDSEPPARISLFKYLLVANRTLIKLGFDRAVRSVAITVSGVNLPRHRIIYTFENGDIHTKDIPVTGNGNPTKFSYQAPRERQISYFIIETGSESSLDGGIGIDIIDCIY
ncbi:hypothetical protein PS624_03740 [Pseudomonas fluorescens]|uniref:Uncharacterized protein n=1 Tax=Pseudomonas fluorescens TaxID=294 RepID=A0A5E6UUQ6_PSEFL|nr:hypothetical protein PS624_03740 [Pseudomonas fluorescens]